MFFEQIIDEWGGMLLVPTKSGEALLTVGIAIALLLSMLGLQAFGEKVSVRKMAYCALCIGLGALLANFNISIGQAGGNITFFSMIVIMLPGFCYGPLCGIAVGVAYGIFQILIDPYLVFPAQIAVDYIFAFGALGLCGLLYKRKNGLIWGYILGVLGRYFFAVFSGAVFFGDYAWEGWGTLSYSLAYNAIYLLPEAVITLIVLAIPPVRSFLYRFRDLAVANFTIKRAFSDAQEDKEVA